MISSISWVPKGLSKPVADLPSKEEIEEIIKKTRVGEAGSGSEEDEERDVDMDVEEVSNHDEPSDEVANALAVAKALGTGTSNSKSIDFDDISLGLRELDMEHYDEEEDEGVELFNSKVGGDLYYPSNDLDPYLKKNKNGNDNDDDNNDSEELEDMAINPTDSVIVCARNEDDVSHLEVWVYEESNDGEDSNMYVHHDLIIPAFPLCTAWLDCPLKGGERGNYIAIGSMEPSIEIWDLDVIEEVEPCVVLGGIAEKKKKKKKKKKAKTSVKYKENSHTDAVLGLAWNKEYRNILASASADKKVKIWDVVTGKCEITMDHHSDKVQAVAWNHHSPRVLLSGSFDRSLVMKDGRADQSSHSGYKWSVSADVEGLAWDPHAEHMFVASLEDGTVQGFDVRAAASGPSGSDLKACFTIHAHEKAVCSVCYNPSVPNLLATGSTDKMVKLWDLSNNQPSFVCFV